MIEKNLGEMVMEIERAGHLSKEAGHEGSYWVNHEDKRAYHNWDIALAAENMGYKANESVKYKIRMYKPYRYVHTGYEEETTLRELIEIERVGNLREDIHFKGSVWIEHESSGSLHDGDIALAAKKAGYEVGDDFKYKIIIEHK